MHRGRVCAYRCSSTTSNVSVVTRKNAPSPVRIMADPAHLRAALTPVVRNAVDHGLEEPDQRSAQGKARKGSLELGTRIDGDAS